jgi:hypothetical protein
MPTNQERSRYARAALNTYARQAYGGISLREVEDRHTLLIDHVSNLRHYCRYNSIDFQHVLSVSRMHFMDEIGDPRTYRNTATYDPQADVPLPAPEPPLLEEDGQGAYRFGANGIPCECSSCQRDRQNYTAGEVQF